MFRVQAWECRFMRWYVSYPILAVGLALGADLLFPGEPVTARAPASSPGTRALDPVAAHHTDATLALASEIEFASRLAAFSPGAQILSPGSGRISVLDYLAQKLAPLDFAPTVTTPAKAQPISTGTWKSVVVREAQPVYQRALLAERAADAPREALARDIQTELSRVGCYFGEIDGVWGNGTKRAVLAFMDRVNASLPAQEPDVFMLSLLRAESEAVCGPSCPAGQTFASNGRCLPTLLVAQRDGPPPHAATQAIASGSDDATAADAPVATTGPRTTTVAEAPVLVRPPTPSFEGRMSVGGPKLDDAAGNEARPTQQAAPDWLNQTAALDGPVADDRMGPAPTDLPELTKSSFDTAVAEERPRKSSAKASGSRSKSAKRSGSGGSYRHVQRLFEHPLGRM
jgi:peptidoglycan hydrolase-like protein with peptidoglycan-binding domain